MKAAGGVAVGDVGVAGATKEFVASAGVMMGSEMGLLAETRGGEAALLRAGVEKSVLVVAAPPAWEREESWATCCEQKVEEACYLSRPRFCWGNGVVSCVTNRLERQFNMLLRPRLSSFLVCDTVHILATSEKPKVRLPWFRFFEALVRL
jgi:hypothetical protein